MSWETLMLGMLIWTVVGLTVAFLFGRIARETDAPGVHRGKSSTFDLPVPRQSTSNRSRRPKSRSLGPLAEATHIRLDL